MAYNSGSNNTAWPRRDARKCSSEDSFDIYCMLNRTTDTYILKFRMISVHSHPHPGRTRISFNNRVIRSTVFLITRKRVGRYMSNVNLSRLVCNFCSFFIINYYKFDIGDMRFRAVPVGIQFQTIRLLLDPLFNPIGTAVMIKHTREFTTGCFDCFFT